MSQNQSYHGLQARGEKRSGTYILCELNIAISSLQIWTSQNVMVMRMNNLRDFVYFNVVRDGIVASSALHDDKATRLLLNFTVTVPYVFRNFQQVFGCLMAFSSLRSDKTFQMQCQYNGHKNPPQKPL